MVKDSAGNCVTPPPPPTPVVVPPQPDVPQVPVVQSHEEEKPGVVLTPDVFLAPPPVLHPVRVEGTSFTRAQPLARTGLNITMLAFSAVIMLLTGVIAVWRGRKATL
jgi:hypothetical protein